MTNLENKTQSELIELWKSIKLTIVGGPSLNQNTVSELTTNLFEVSGLIIGDLPVIDSDVLSNSLN